MQGYAYPFRMQGYLKKRFAGVQNEIGQNYPLYWYELTLDLVSLNPHSPQIFCNENILQFNRITVFFRFTTFCVFTERSIKK